MTGPRSDGYLPEDHPMWGWEFIAEDFVFARLDEELAAADKLTGPNREAALARAASLRLIAAWHSCYVGDNGRSWGRCFTCPPSNGFPCTTMRALASMWPAHRDYRQGWADESTFLAAEIAAGGFRAAYLAKAPPKRKDPPCTPTN